MASMRFGKTILIFAAVFLLFAARSTHAQDPPQESSSKPASPPDDMKPKSAAKQKKDTATQNAPDQPTWDPLATVAKPGYAIPFRYLGEAQEKKGLKKQAIKSYRRYLDLYPHAEDGDKVRKKIDKLYKEVEKEKKG